MSHLNRRPQDFHYFYQKPNREKNLIFKERHSNRARANVCTDGTSDSCDRKFISMTLPDFFAVSNVFLKHIIGKAAVSESHRFIEIDAATVYDQLAEQVVTFFGTSCLTH